MKTIFHHEKSFTATETCVRCCGEGKANPLTFPDQGHHRGCRLCRGTGKIKVTKVPVSVIQ